MRRALADAFEMWEEIRIEIAEVKTADDCLIALGRTTNVGKGSAPGVEYESAYLFRMREDKIAYFRAYQSHGEALVAAGLSE